jgi:hypothetical protein
MSRIHQLINEIKEIGAEPSHRNAIQIYKILDGNSSLFASRLETENFSPILNNFENLASASAREFNSSSFANDYSRNFQLLSFYLEKVL